MRTRYVEGHGGDDEQLQAGMFNYIALEGRISKDHPLRGIRQLVDEVLKTLSPEFDKLSAKIERPSIPPEAVAAGITVTGVLFHPQ